MNKLLKNFQERETLQEAKYQRKCTVESREIINCFEDEPKQSLLKVANQCDVSTTIVHRTMKSTQYKVSKLQIVQLLYSHDYASRIAFAEAMLEKIRNSSNFIKLLMFSDEANFHLHGGVNSQNFKHWAKVNSHWTIQRPLNSLKITVWAAMG